jgi:adenine-specific DNA-methyltransferase
MAKRKSVTGRRKTKRATARSGGSSSRRAENYKHPTAESLLRPDVGTQAQFKKKKPPKQYRYDSSLAPEMNWDGQNPAREEGEAMIARVLDAESLEDAKAAAAKLKAMSKPFLNWAGKAERLSFDVPTLPLFVHERLSTKAILETLKGHRKDRGAEQPDMFELFADPCLPIHEQVLRAYEHKGGWVNRMILGDSLVVMNSLLEYEGLGGQVQMIYMDPPYGVKFGSNFQPFVRKRDVKHGDDDDMTREPEMVQAYRDTWELGLHSYLSYLRDRLLLARDLLQESGSIFVQISDENLHHVRALLDEVFGPGNLAGLIVFRKTGGLKALRLASVGDYLLWYAKDLARDKYRQLYLKKVPGDAGATQYRYVREADGTLRELTAAELPTADPAAVLTHDNLTSQGNPVYEYTFRAARYKQNFKPPAASMDRLAAAGRLIALGNTLRFVRMLRDFPYFEVNELWEDVGISGFAESKLYVVQTAPLVVQRCILMTTDPGDLVLDPTCGSGTTAYVAEQWGRRWITIDTSRVPLALARQRLLTATYPWYELREPERGPAGGFVYKRKQNSKGEEVGGIVPHVTLKSIANDEPPQEEVLVDRPEVENKITRVSGPFTVEATIPTPVDWEPDGQEDSGMARVAEGHESFVDRMLEVLRRSPVLRLEGNRTATLKSIRQPAKTLSLSAEATVENGDPRPVALVFGPENGAVSEKLVYEAAREAHGKSYSHLYVIGFAIQPNARKLVEECEAAVGVPATYVQATPDLMMGDLLKNLRSSQIFSVCGLPEIEVRSTKKGRFEVELLGIDVFDPITTDVDHKGGDDVPAWFLDTDYNGLCFHVCQAFFPRTNAWDSLKRALKGEYEDSVWDHLAGTVSAPFDPGEHGQVAVKVIDDRGNELLVVEALKGKS